MATSTAAAPVTSTPPAATDSPTFRAYREVMLPTYAPSLVLTRGEGAYVFDEDGRRYLDFNCGVAVNSLGHAHPKMIAALTAQVAEMTHCSNWFANPQQVTLARRLVELTGPGRVFFANSGAEANECLYKTARLFGHDEGRYEIITTLKSFHGRTMASIAATGQDKVKKGFEPITPGFTHVPFNDLKAIESALTPTTVAVLIEGIQGEGGIHVASPEYLLGLRALCDRHNLLLLIDAVQCGMFRTGKFQSYETILAGHPDAAKFHADAISMAKSLGGGFPIGAAWISEKIASLFAPGMHGTTYGGSPLACAAALTVLDAIHDEKLDKNIARQGEKLKSELMADAGLRERCLVEVRGYGGLLGLQLKNITAMEAFAKLRGAGMLTCPAGDETLRLLPPLNVSDAAVEEALGIIRATL